MYKTILKIENATENLAMVGYNWVGESYEHRLEKIMNQIKEKTGGYPSANMQPIRKMTISVSDRTNELMIDLFIKDVRDNFGIDCFQYTLDKKTKQACFLFDWYDREGGQCRYIYKTLQKKIEVMAMYHLCIVCDSKNDEILRLYLKNTYHQNKEIYKSLLEKVGNAKIGRESYRLLEIIINYVELVCQGKVK